MIIPQIGQWVICKTEDGAGSDPGKVEIVSYNQAMFRASFLVESGGTAEEWKSFNDIQKIIKDKKIITQCEADYKKAFC